MKKYLLGIDVGTTGTKSILFTLDGKAEGHAYRAYETSAPQRGYSEQNPLDWWKAICETVREVCADVDVSEVASISLSTQGGTLVPVDSDFNPVRPAIVWSDTRCTAEREAFKNTVGDLDAMYQRTGWGLAAGLPLFETKWIKDNEPENFKKIAMLLSVPDFISVKMTGKAVIDISNAGINEFANVREHKYDEALLNFAGVKREQLPEIVKSCVKIGNLTEKAADELGLTTETVFVSGAHDQYAVALGAGAIDAGDILIGSGTSWAITAICGVPQFDSGLSQSESAVAGRWGSLLSLSNGGVCLEWLRKSLAIGSDGKLLSYKEIDYECEKVTASERGLYFYPFGGKLLSDKETGAFGSSTGTFVGMDISDNRFALARAIMEGVVFQVAWLLEQFEDKSDSIKLAGGAAKSALWTQILADITGRSVVIPEVSDLACVGAAVMAGVGCGIFKDAVEGHERLSVNERIVRPRVEEHEKYIKAYCEYKRIGASLGNIYSK